MKPVVIGLSCGAALLALAACDRPSGAPAAGNEPAATAPAAFAHALTEDVSGYYVPAAETQFGDWRLHHLFLGQAEDFADWEDGRRSTTFAPVMIEFENTAAPVIQTELGETRQRARLIPTAYSVRDDLVRFEGRSDDLGRVTFEGRLDQGQLAMARRNLGASEQAALTGTLKVGSRTFDGVSMRWWAGD